MKGGESVIDITSLEDGGKCVARRRSVETSENVFTMC
jgi:hypothetical protein